MRWASAFFALSLLSSPAATQLQILPAPAGPSVMVARNELKAAGQPCKKVVAAHRNNGIVDAVCLNGGSKRERYLIFRAQNVDKVFALRCVAARQLVKVSCDDGTIPHNEPGRSAGPDKRPSR